MPNVFDQFEVYEEPEEQPLSPRELLIQHLEEETQLTTTAQAILANIKKEETDGRGSR